MECPLCVEYTELYVCQQCNKHIMCETCFVRMVYENLDDDCELKYIKCPFCRYSNGHNTFYIPNSHNVPDSPVTSHILKNNKLDMTYLVNIGYKSSFIGCLFCTSSIGAIIFSCFF